jgi:RNA methyltransferase, TrmH family
MKITSTANPRVKAAAKLRNSRERTAQNRFAINGLREIGRALDGGIAIHEFFVCDELCNDGSCAPLLARLEKFGAARFDVPPPVYSVLAYGDRADGIIAIADITFRKFDELQIGDNPLIAVVEGVEKPGNLGAVLRSADGAGVSAVIVADGGSDLYNPNVIRASMGTVFTLPICEASNSDTLAWLRGHKLAMYAARVDGSADYTACNYTTACAIILGSESNGLSEAWRGDDITPIRLPMCGVADSLNLSATAAVLFYEARRQRLKVDGRQ